MRRGAIFFIIALAVAALLHSRRKPLEDARDERGDGDWPFIPSGGLPSAVTGRGARNCASALRPVIEADGWITVTPITPYFEERN